MSEEHKLKYYRVLLKNGDVVYLWASNMETTHGVLTFFDVFEKETVRTIAFQQGLWEYAYIAEQTTNQPYRVEYWASKT